MQPAPPKAADELAKLQPFMQRVVGLTAYEDQDGLPFAARKVGEGLNTMLGAAVAGLQQQQVSRGGAQADPARPRCCGVHAVQQGVAAAGPGPKGSGAGRAAAASRICAAAASWGWPCMSALGFCSLPACAATMAIWCCCCCCGAWMHCAVLAVLVTQSH
jgi:hypothetical protein